MKYLVCVEDVPKEIEAKNLNEAVSIANMNISVMPIEKD